MAENNAREVSPMVAIFQRAHGRVVTLQRIDEQLAGLLEQRRRVQDELRAIQNQINDELNRVIQRGQNMAAQLPGPDESAEPVSQNDDPQPVP